MSELFHAMKATAYRCRRRRLTSGYRSLHCSRTLRARFSAFQVLTAGLDFRRRARARGDKSTAAPPTARNQQLLKAAAEADGSVHGTSLVPSCSGQGWHLPSINGKLVLSIRSPQVASSRKGTAGSHHQPPPLAQGKTPHRRRLAEARSRHPPHSQSQFETRFRG